jgi:PBSX family phage portal protein
LVKLSRVGFYKISKSESSSASMQLPDDNFVNEYQVNGLVQPELDPLKLKVITENSNILPQCIDAYRRNITGHGVALEYKDGENDDTASEEWDVAERFIATTCLSKPLESLLGELVDDLESCGNAYLEIANATGEFPAIYRIPPQFMRCTPEKERINIAYQVMIKGEVETFEQSIYVRSYCQKRSNQIVWFDPFGKKGERNQIIHLKVDQDGAYGKPRWIGGLPGVLGVRRAEELNLKYFDDGRMLSMILTAINGKLTDDSIDAVSKIKGAESQGGILYLEVEADEDEDNYNTDKKSKKPEIKLDKLNDLLQQDALFLGYTKDKNTEILSSFCLPPILVGKSDDYNRATADAALRFAEAQVFRSYRKWLMDEIFNYRLFPAHGIHKVKAYLRGPELVDPDEQNKIIELLANNGILLVKHLIPLAERALGTTIEEDAYPPGYLDTPIGQLTTPQMDMLPFSVSKALKGDSDKIAKIKEYLHFQKVNNHV